MSETSTILDFSSFANKRRIRQSLNKIEEILTNNRATLGRLFRSGALFEDRGLRAGRDLLLAHQHLLRITQLIETLGDLHPATHRDPPPEVQQIFTELDELLSKTNELTSRTGRSLSTTGK